MANEKKHIVHLKLKKKHPRKQIYLRGVLVKGYVFAKYEISEEAYNDLKKDAGVKAWIACQELDKKTPATPSELKAQKALEEQQKKDDEAKAAAAAEADKKEAAAILEAQQLEDQRKLQEANAVKSNG